MNDDFSTIFHDNIKVKNSLLAFQEVVKSAEKLDGIFEKSLEKQEMVQQSLSPPIKMG